MPVKLGGGGRGISPTSITSQLGFLRRTETSAFMSLRRRRRLWLTALSNSGGAGATEKYLHLP